MSLVSMKVPDADSANAPMDIDANPYGYGLMVSLSEEQVEALGLNVNTPPAGSQVAIRAIAFVTRVTQEAEPGEELAEGESSSDVDVRLCFQITDMEVTASTGQAATANQASMLYG